MSQSLLVVCVCACMHGRVGASVCERVCACMRLCVCLRMCFCVCTWCGFCIASYIYPTSSFHFCYLHKGKWHNLWHTWNDLGITWGDHPRETLVYFECPYELLRWLSTALGLWFGWVLLFIPCPTHYSDRMPAQHFLYCQYSASWSARCSTHVGHG